MPYTQPIGVHGFACNCCGEPQLPHNEVWVCPDCGAVICKNCVDTGKIKNHVCDEEDEEE